jgi:Putative esterase
MKHKSLFVGVAALSLTGIVVSDALRQTVNAAVSQSIPPGANITEPDGPFYVDTSGLDFSTVPPTRDPMNSKYPRAAELTDREVPSSRSNGNFIIGPTHDPAPETVTQSGIAKGAIISFEMTSSDSVIYRPGLVRDEEVSRAALGSASTAPGDPSNLIVTSSQSGTWTRTVSVYVPHRYIHGARAPFLVAGDRGLLDDTLFITLDNLIGRGRLPPMIAISIGSGGQDAQGSERGFEYDTVSGAYADWVEREVLPLVERHAHVRLTRDPDGRATMGLSSSGAAAFSMAWFHPELYHRVLAYSPTMVNQQWPHNPALPGGAWEYHSTWPGPVGRKLAVSGYDPPKPTPTSPGSPLILSTPRKPIRFWFECGDRDLFYPIAALSDGMHDWVLASESMASVLAAAGYDYQFVFSRNAGHVDRPTVAQTLPEALEWVWSGYREHHRPKATLRR